MATGNHPGTSPILIPDGQAIQIETTADLELDCADLCGDRDPRQVNIDTFYDEHLVRQHAAGELALNIVEFRKRWLKFTFDYHKAQQKQFPDAAPAPAPESPQPEPTAD